MVPPFTGGIGNAAPGGPPALGLAVLLLDTSLLLQPASTHNKSASKKIDSFSLLNISLRIFRGCGLVGMILRQLFAWDSIVTFDPTAEVNQLAAFRTEWTKGIVFPLGWFPAGWTLHES